MKCIVNLNKQRVHITNDADVDIFEDIPDETTWQEFVEKLGYPVNTLDTRVIGEPAKTSTFRVSEVSDLVGKHAIRSIIQKDAEKFVEKYGEAFLYLSENTTFRTVPGLLDDCALCRENYPEGMDILVSTEEENKEKAIKLFNAMYSDIDMLTEDMLEFNFKLTII